MWSEYLFPFKEYLHYFLLKEDQHALQSPFAFDMYSGLLKHIKASKEKNQHLVQRMTMLTQDAEVLEISDYGAGSKRLKNQRRKTSSIAKHSSSSAKFAALLQYFCTKTPAINVLELGTCLGVSTAFIQEAVKGEFFSFEGSTALAVKAQAHFGLERVQFILGDIRKTLPEFLKTNPKIDFAWIDATHTYEGSMSYFNSLIPHAHEESIFVIGDIHWSKGMKKAWDTIKSHPKISCSFDFYECGVLFFKKGLMTQHYVLSI